MSVTRSPVEVLGPDLEQDDARAWRRRAREFARDAVGPVGAIVDRMDPAEVVAAGSPVLALLAQAHREGFTRVGGPCRAARSGLATSDEFAVVEELATADAALAALLLVAPVPFRCAAVLGAPSLLRDVAVPYLSGVRDDWVGCSSLVAVPGVRAARAPGGWSLSGATPEVVGGSIATHALVSCAVEGTPSPGVAVVVLKASGVRRSAARDRVGLRGLCCARLVLDHVRVRADHVVAGRGPAPEAAGAYAHAAAALVALGIGRAAYEGALRWAREDLWAGERHAGHADRDHVRPELARMYTLLETTRGLVRATYLHNSRRRGHADVRALALRARAAGEFAAEAAHEVAASAARLCAAAASDDGVAFLDGSVFHPDKLLRDAQAAHQRRKEEHHGTRQDP